MNFYKTLIILSCLSSVFSSYLVYQIKNEPKVVKTEIIKQEIPAIKIEPVLNIPKMELSDSDKIFLETLFNKTINVTIDNTKHVLSDDLFLKEPIKESVKAKVVK